MLSQLWVFGVNDRSFRSTFISAKFLPNIFLFPISIVCILKARQNNESAAVVRQMEQQAKNLSLSRARAVRESFLEYCKKKQFTIDESQFVAVGLGITTPKFNPPRTKEEWAANRRVVFRIKQIEAELTEFSPL